MVAGRFQQRDPPCLRSLSPRGGRAADLVRHGDELAASARDARHPQPAPSPRPPGSSQSPGVICWCRPGTPRWSCSDWTMTTLSCPAGCPKLLPSGTYRFANAPADAAARRARLCARLLSLHALPQERRTKRSLSRCPKASMATTFAHRRRRDACARPHQHAGERHGSGRAGRGGARPGQAPWRLDRVRIIGDDPGGEQFSAHPCGRPRRRARAAADRLELGRRRRIPRSRWSAKACASIPAASTSSRTAPC